jgi:hypothetical protein
MTTYTSVNAADFITHDLGVNVGLDRTGTAYTNTSAVGSAMSYLGLDNMRATISTIEPAALATLAGQGFHFDIERDPQWISDAQFQSRIDALQSAHPGSIIAIEGMNEIDGWTTVSAAKTEQTALSNMVHSDPLLANVQLYNFTLGQIDNPAGYQAIGDMSAYAVAQPTHVYFGGGQPLGALEVGLSDAKYVVPNGPNVVTEIGASTSSTVSWGVDQATQAKQILNAVMDGARTNTTMYLYELVDNNATGTTGLNPHWGLFNSDWTPKPAATALHNLTTILTAGADPNAAPDSFSYTLSGLPWKGEAVMGSGYSMVFEKSATVHDIAVWAEPQVWNDATHSAVAAPTNAVTVSLGSTYASVDVYDPLVGTSPIQHLTSVSSVTVNVSDHPLVIEVNSGSASGGGSAPSAPATPTAPAAPSVPDLTAAADTGSSSTDNWTKDNTPTFAGTAVAGSTVNLYDGSTLVGSGTADSSGNWSVTTSTLADGSHTITATDTTANGTSTASAGLGVTIDTHAPSAPTTPDMTTASDNGTSSTDNVTTLTTPTFTGSVTSAPNAVVALYDAGRLGDGGQFGELVDHQQGAGGREPRHHRDRDRRGRQRQRRFGIPRRHHRLGRSSDRDGRDAQWCVGERRAYRRGRARYDQREKRKRYDHRRSGR